MKNITDLKKIRDNPMQIKSGCIPEPPRIVWDFKKKRFKIKGKSALDWIIVH